MKSINQKKSRIKKILLFLSFLFWVIISGCQKEKPPIKIGFAGNLTEENAAFSINARNGFLLAVDDINENGGIGGRKLEAIVRDDRLDPETAIKIDQEFIRENVAVIIGHVTGEMCEVVLPLINETNLVMISPTAPTDKLTFIDDNLFRINPPTEETSIATAKLAYSKGVRKMAVLYDLSSKKYAESKYLFFKTTFDALGGNTSACTFTSGPNVSLPGLAEELMQCNPEGYFIVASPLDTAIICQHLRELDPSGPIFISPWAYHKDFLENGGTMVEGVLLVHSFQKDCQNESFLKFKENYVKHYKTVPGIWATFSYEAVMVFAQAFSQNPDPEKLKETILQIKKFKGLQGDIQFDRYGDNQRKPSVLTVKNGVFVDIK